MAIPKIIHQTARDAAALAPEIKESIARMRAAHPDWEYRFYSDGDVAAFIRSNCDARVPKLLERLNPRYGVVVADLFRYLICYSQGGVYLDIKSEIASSLNDLIKPDDEFLLAQWANRLCDKYPTWGLYPELERVPGGEFHQWHVMCRAGHPFLAEVIRSVLFNLEYYDANWFNVGRLGVVRVSGPVAYTQAIAPMLPKCAARFFDPEAAGVRYSLYPSPLDHMASPDHYSKCREPIMLPG